MPRKQQCPCPEPQALRGPPEGYQPTKAELEEEFDMPGLTLEQARAFFMRPFRHLYPAPETRQ